MTVTDLKIIGLKMQGNSTFKIPSQTFKFSIFGSLILRSSMLRSSMSWSLLSRSIEGLSKVYRWSIEGLSKVYRRSIEGLSKVYRRSIEVPSMFDLFQAFQNFEFMFVED